MLSQREKKLHGLQYLYDGFQKTVAALQKLLLIATEEQRKGLNRSSRHPLAQRLNSG